MQSGLYRLLSLRALCVGIVCGLAGMVVDVDHIPQYIFNVGIGPLFTIPGLFDASSFISGRPIHPLVLYISGVTFACTGGLLLQHSVRVQVRKIVLVAKRAISARPVRE
jgi:hypothetical protein